VTSGAERAVDSAMAERSRKEHRKDVGRHHGKDGGKGTDKHAG